MDLSSIKTYVGRDWELVQERIGNVLCSDIDLLNVTNGTVLSHSGKQLRPLLSILVARACSGGVINDTSVRYAAASELLHNATLLHDDVADDSDKRRGVPTIRSLLGPSVSVLVGDYWLVKAMELVFGDPVADIGVIRLFSKTLGDLAEGEMLQLQKAQNCDTDENDYLKIIYSKTASLFEAACVSGAASVGASGQMRDAAGKYAVALGLAFQIKDDMLDYAGTDTAGKPLGVDVLERKITLPLLGALAAVSQQKSEHVRRLVREIDGSPDMRDVIVDFVKENGGLDYAARRLGEYVDEAVAALAAFPDSREKDCLIDLAYFTAQRIM